MPPTLPLPPSPVAQGTGNGWLWVIYSDGTVDNSYAPGFLMSDTDFQSIRAGGTTLVGSGQTSAFVTHGTENQVLNGSCSLTVLTGAAPSPTWSGSFNMANGPGNSLGFQAGGIVVTSGQLAMNSLSGYSLVINGLGFDSATLTSQQLVNSFLVGPGGPIASGAHGHFFFAHGPSGDPKVDVMFGVNFP